jgi:hypothetical protein
VRDLQALPIREPVCVITALSPREANTARLGLETPKPANRLRSPPASPAQGVLSAGIRSSSSAAARTPPDQKFAEPVAVSSTPEQCIRLPPSSSPGGFGLVPLRARRDAHAAPERGDRQLRVSRYLRSSSRVPPGGYSLFARTSLPCIDATAPYVHSTRACRGGCTRGIAATRRQRASKPTTTTTCRRAPRPILRPSSPVRAC